jgi:peptidoglycan/xylan/chitin deacetylase (PgdA/CDA1 family)
MPRIHAAALVFLVAVAACGDAPAPDTDAPGQETAGPPSEPVSREPAAPALAITVDDLPWVGALPPGMTRLEATDAILAALDAHEVEATAYVNCDRVPAGAPVLRRWLEAGHQLGNHTSGHLDLNVADPAAWADDVRTCDAFLRELTGQASLTFRYPYLRRGHTPERYRTGRAVIDEVGSIIAPVTIDTGDWILVAAYVDALRAGDQTRVDTLVDAYLDHMVRAARHYREAANGRLSRDVRHILLVHANALLAHHLDTLLGRLAEEGFQFIPLELALQDPVYQLPDDYLGRDGLSWLYRIPPAMPGGAEWDRAEAMRLRGVARQDR